MRYTFHGGIPVGAARAVGDTPVAFTPRTVILKKDGNYSSLLSVGEKVNKGSVLALSDDPGALPVISSVCGTVKEISEDAIVIETDTGDGGEVSLICACDIETPLSETPPELLCEMMRTAAIATPACPHGAHSVCERVRAFDGTRRVIIDCTSADGISLAGRYIVRDMCSELIGGIKLLIRASLAIGAVIVVDDSDIRTIRRLERAVDGKNTVLLVSEAKYPICDKKLLMHATIKKECPPDKSPADFGCAIFDAEACVAVYNAVIKRLPMTDRLISFFKKGGVSLLSIPIGTGLSELTEAQAPEALYASLGMFFELRPLSELKDFGIYYGERTVVVRGRVRVRRAFSCIKCMRCEDACPMYLSPYRMLMAKGDEKKLASLGIDCCIGCNCCSAVCPSGIDVRASFLIKKEEKEDDGR